MPGPGGSRAGRPNASKAKFRFDLLAYAKKVAKENKLKHADPHYTMIDMMIDRTVTADLRFQCAKELAQYLQPKLRAIEVVGEDGEPLVIQRIDYRDAVREAISEAREQMAIVREEPEQ